MVSPPLRISHALLGVLWLPTSALPQGVPITTLGKPVAEFPEGYASLTSVRELPDGRVMVIEQCERVVKLLDLAAGSATQIGRSGGGPGEYRIPARLFGLPGDSSALYDPGNRRYLVIHPDGKPGRFFEPLPSLTERHEGAVLSVGFSPSYSDARGRFYARSSPLRASGAALFRSDTVTIERWDPYSGRRDTVVVRPGAGASRPILPGQEVPFRTGIQWAVASDGRVALVHPGDYHVEFIVSAGARSAGPPIPFPRVKVSEGHKQQWRAEQGLACPASALTMTGPDGRTFTATRAPMREPTEWPEHLPPFLVGAAVLAPDGVLWVRRTGAAEAPPTYDLIDPEGRVAHRVVLAARAKLLGFGRGTVYLARVDDDDLQYLQQYRLPTRR